MATASITSKRKLIIDTDCGTDDALAIMFALVDPSVEILAITCVAGNCSINDVTRNIGTLLDHFHKQHIPYFAGASRPLLVPYGNQCSLWEGHGLDGFAGISFSPDFVQPSTHAHSHEHAANALVRIVSENAGEVHLVTLGPLTNIALAVSLDPSFSGKVASVSAMMGSYSGQGNIGCSAEFNVAYDSEAAAMVLQNKWHQFNMITWCLTNECALRWSWYRQNIANSKTYTGKLIRLLTLPYSKLCGGDLDMPDVTGEINMRDSSHFNVNDAIAMISFLDPSCIKHSEKLWCTIELAGVYSRGVTLFDHRHSLNHDPNCTLIVKLDKNIYQNAFEKLLEWTLP